MRLTCALLLGLLLPAEFANAATTHAHDANAPAAQENTVHKNVIYGMHGGTALLMDVYEPTESNGHALLFIAGSGYHWPTGYDAGGIKDAVAGSVLGGGSHKVFAEAGFTVFVINYRKAPTFRYPSAIEDSRRAVRFIRHQGHEYGVTEEAIAAFGISAGAHMTLMLALCDGDGNPESEDPVERQSCKIELAIAYAGASDLTSEDWFGTAGEPYLTSYFGAPAFAPDGTPTDVFSKGRRREASPIRYVDGDDPPVLLIHGDADDVAPIAQSRTLAARLREHIVVELVEIPGGGHDFVKVLEHDPSELPSFPAMARWLQEHLPKAD